MLVLAEPFARAGLRVDMVASDRVQRRLVLRPPEDADDGSRWSLDAAARGRVQLTRTVRHADGTEAVLHASGPDAAPLLGRMLAVPSSRHFDAVGPAVLARDYTLGADGQPVLQRAAMTLPGLQLLMTVPTGARLAATLAITPDEGATRPALPEDLLAVLGWNWSRLVPTRQGWSGRLRLRASGAEARTRRAEAAASQAARHLARTWSEPPARYHARWRRARWGVFLRRGIPSFTALGLVGLVLLSAALEFRPTPMQMLLMYHLPTLVIAASFLMQELPRFEIPPWPRVPAGTAWAGTTPGR